MTTNKEMEEMDKQMTKIFVELVWLKGRLEDITDHSVKPGFDELFQRRQDGEEPLLADLSRYYTLLHDQMLPDIWRVMRSVSDNIQESEHRGILWDHVANPNTIILTMIDNLTMTPDDVELNIRSLSGDYRFFVRQLWYRYNLFQKAFDRMLKYPSALNVGTHHHLSLKCFTS